jgi:hypothetical protein
MSDRNEKLCNHDYHEVICVGKIDIDSLWLWAQRVRSYFYWDSLTQAHTKNNVE